MGLVELLVAAIVSATSPPPAPVPLQIERPEMGDRVGTIWIPKIGIRVPVRQGTRTQRELDRGVGHVQHSYLPGMGGTIITFGHRITPVLRWNHGPYRYINRLIPGNRIVFTTKYGRYVYRVSGHEVVHAKGRTLVGMPTFKPTLKGPEELILAACTPPGEDSHRYVVHARLIE